jgi:hypothetical protein
MPRPLLALTLAAALPALADDRAPAAAPGFEPRPRVQQAADAARAAVVVVRGIAAEAPAPAMSPLPDPEVIRAVAALCRADPASVTAGLPALPARF